MSAETTVLLVDDDSMVRGWVRLALEGSEFRIAGEAASAQDALELVPRRRPDLLLLDYRLPDRVGSDLLHELRAAGLRTPAILMTANPERGFNEAAREAGAQGTALKSGRSAELLQALRAVAGGEASFDARHPARARGRGPLSPRELEVLRLLAGGATNREIAGELSVGEETVKTLVARAYAKLGARRRAEAVAAAYDRGLL